MNKSVMLSIQPKYCELIANGKKTIEVRKTRPTIETPFKCYIYATKSGNRIILKNDRVFEISKALTGKVIGYFVCDRIEEFHEYELSPSKKFYEFEKARLDLFLNESCLSYNELCDYRKNLPYYKALYGWHVSDLKIYDTPKELGEFRKPCNHANDCCTCKWALYRYRQPRYKPAKGQRIYYGEEFAGCGNKITRPPQSWCYVGEL